MQGDLALEMGCSVAQIKRLTEREFRFWHAYRARKMLPARRLEIYLAQIALTIAKVNGNQNKTLDDFLIQEIAKVKEMTATEGAMTIAAFAGAGVRKLGQKRKKKE